MKEETIDNDEDGLFRVGALNASLRLFCHHTNPRSIHALQYSTCAPYAMLLSSANPSPSRSPSPLAP